MSDPSAAQLGQLVIWYAAFLFSLTVHEASHALAALWGGDRTAYRGGQVSLNPLPHVRREPMGTLILPLLSFAFAGWTMGWASTPFDPRWARRFPSRHALMSLAGPVANFALAAIALAVLRGLLAAGVFTAPARASFAQLVDAPAGAGPLVAALALGLSVLLSLNLLLGIFNLIPLPPLDGSGVLEGLAPATGRRLLAQLRRHPALTLVALLVAWQLLDALFAPAFEAVLHVLHPAHRYS